MPVYDFNNTSEQTEMVRSECTYTVFYSDETEATPEKPMLVLDNKRGSGSIIPVDILQIRGKGLLLNLKKMRVFSAQIF